MDDEEFDWFVAPLNYPMFVLTVPGSARSDRSGCLIGFATQCSIAPPRFLACLSKANHTYRSAAEVQIVAVHALSADDHELAALFGGETGDEVDKFQQCDWTEGPDGVPLLAHCSRLFIGAIDDRVDLGDHEGLVLRPTYVGGNGSSRVLTLAAVRDITAGHPA